jgi:protein phosphatase
MDPEVRTAFEVDLGAATHQGHVRENNEDHYLVMEFGRSLNNLKTNLDKQVLEPSYASTGYGMFVADGIGSLAGGEVASRWALSKLVELLVETPDWIMKLERREDLTTVLQRVTQRFLEIDETLKENAKWDVSLRGMGTTLTVAFTLGSDLVIGHVGDSRAYLLRGGRLRQLTIDHTLGQSLIDAGIATRDDPAPRSMRHVLTAALGSLGNRIEPQVQHLQVRPGDQLLLCSDGLTEMVEDETVAKALDEAKSAQVACDNLVDLALSAGGIDNITVVTHRFGALPSSVPSRLVR